MFRILFIGDISGRPGREMVAKVLPSLKKDKNIDLVVANVENLAHGRGATVKTVKEVMSYGIDFMTAGNHIWRRREFFDLLDGSFPLIRAMNYPSDLPGKGYEIIDLGAKGKVLVGTVLGRAFFSNENVTSDMIRPIESMLEETKGVEFAASLLEVHAEATAEKIAVGMHYDGMIGAIVGTHTHVPTADERILSKGSAFITDVGMVGPLESCLWVQPEIIFEQLKYPYAPSYEIQEEGKCRFDAVILDFEEGGRTCSNIQRVNKVL